LRKSVFIAIALCICACTKDDTDARNPWGRSVEPQLNGADAWQPCRRTPPAAGRVVEDAQCAKEARIVACDDILVTRQDAVRALVSQPGCTDIAITALEGFAQGDPLAKSDLAGAYYVRAQREDRAADLLNAVETATEATAAAPKLPSAHFNRALALEGIGLSEDAVEEWSQAARLDEWQWAAEARAHRARLLAQHKNSASFQWPAALRQLEAALQSLDARRIAALIAPFPTTATKYFEETVLPRTAAAPSAQNLAAAGMLATALSERLQGDRFSIEAVDAIAHPKDARALREGHAQFARALAGGTFASNAGPAFHAAAELLARGGSPLALRAELEYATVLSYEPDRAGALQLLEHLQQEAQHRGYPHLLARFNSLGALCLGFQNQYLKSIASYETALAGAKRLQDSESIAAYLGNRFSVIDTAGQHDLAWRDVVQAMRYEKAVVDVQSHHRLLGDAGKVARALRHPQVALLYQNAAIRVIERAFAAPSPNVRKLRANLAAALRHRAEIELDLGRLDQANTDLRKSAQMDGNVTDPNARAILESRMQEITGRAFLATRPQLAIAAFTRALAVSEGDKFRTARAALFAQRAEAHRRAGNRGSAETDLRAALAELHAEEDDILKTRRRGAGEQLWSSYFSRFQETYRFLIRLLMDDHRAGEAFVYAERARAFEPLDLILKLELTPKRFREMAGRGVDVKAIQESLPDDTFLIEYTLLEDRTYAWILSHHDALALTLPTKRKDVDRWSETISKAVRKLDDHAFEDGLIAPYDGLLAAPLSRISRLRGGESARIVIVPDGAMHALPFAALRNPNTERYVIQDHEVTIAPSALLYVFSRMRDEELPAGQSALLVADPWNDEPPLPYARSEVAAIGSLYPQYEMLIGQEATISRFLARARDYAVVHVAAHALVDPSLPSQSRILLTKSEQDDGALDAEEMLTDLRLEHTRLMVLSTCSSAGGAPVGPEGVAPLVRPILTAGVPAVIGTLWDVHDPTAERFFVSFHQHYREGRSAAEALRAAQLELLGARGFKPMAWAPFQVIGHASSPFAPPHDTKKEKPP
jgi:CHAT domain-containing protein